MSARRRGCEPVRGRFCGLVGDTATLGTAGGGSIVVDGTAAATEVDDELDGAGAEPAVDEVGRIVVVGRGALVDVVVEVVVDEVVVDEVVDVGMHQAGTVVLVLVLGGAVDDDEAVFATVVLGATVVVDGVHGPVVEVTGAAVVVVCGVVVDVGTVVVLLLVDDGAVVVDTGAVVGTAVVVVTGTYEYETQTVADASTMIRFT